ncbi:CDP-alcohol phosphatidyltransferase family protein, partial [Vibrio sp. V27_P1S3P104]|uniref:CDP-alcohol phosphatidyltransferase family protein n=3 Tax=Vibrionaceae TaxID=641 RepID=UPI001372FD76
MLDRYTVPAVRWPLSKLAHILDSVNITANQITVFGFLLGSLSLPALLFEQYLLALLLILINRICDGLDGAVARIQ